MLDDGMKITTLIIPHIIIFHMEEYGLTELQVRRKFGWRSWDYDRHTVRRYLLRKRYYLEHEQMGLKKYAGPIW